MARVTDAARNRVPSRLRDAIYSRGATKPWLRRWKWLATFATAEVENVADR